MQFDVSVDDPLQNRVHFTGLRLPEKKCGEY